LGARQRCKCCPSFALLRWNKRWHLGILGGQLVGL
jgi:hypothetical protein